MNKSTPNFTRALIAVAAVVGIGVAALPQQALAKQCGIMKPYGAAGPMHFRGPGHYGPPVHPAVYAERHAARHHACGQQGAGHPRWCRQKAGLKHAGKPAAVAHSDILDTAAAAHNFATLIRAAEAAGLTDTLREQGPLTVFAPSDAAFAKLPQATLDELLADRAWLVDFLSYHVVPGRLTAADLLQQRSFKTLQGSTLSVEQLSVAKANIEASNGIIHVIDSVLIPSP